MNNRYTNRKRIRITAGVIALAAGLAVWTTALLSDTDTARVWRAVLINFLFFTPLAAGMAVWPAAVHLSRGTWTEPIDRKALSSVGFAVPSLIALTALALGSKAWAPWWNSADLPQGVWLYPPFVFGRDFVVLAAFWIAAFCYARRPGTATAFLTVLGYMFTFSLLGFDLVMALDPLWYSSLFGGYFFISGLYGAIAAWTFICALDLKSKAGTLHDLGRLTLAFSILTSYLLFAQLLPVWYENLGPEVRFFIPRMHAAWGRVSVLLLVLAYLGPLGTLLTIRSKRVRWRISTSVALILAGLWIERLWLVQPVFQQSPLCGVPELSMAAAFLGAFILSRASSDKLPKSWHELANSSENE